MRATAPLQKMPGFLSRTLEHAKRQTGFAMRMEGIRSPNRPKPLIQFEEAGKLDHVKVMTDRGIGGYSEATLTFQPGTMAPLDMKQMLHPVTVSEEQEPPHVVFKGTISTDIAANRQDTQRSGFAGWRTRDLGWSLFGTVLWDLGQYDYVALRVKSDGRKYFVNFQTESIVPTDLHQHILPARTPGEWETVTIPFGSFVRTNYGMPVEPQNEMQLMRVKSVGISLLDRVRGPFELCIADVYATNASGRALERRDSGFDIAPPPKSIMDDEIPKRKPGEPEQILI